MISFVIPAFNEEESVEPFYKELRNIAPSIDPLFEIIFIDDGSTDNTLEVLQKIAQKDNKIKVYSFRRNLGKAEALSFGFRVAKGDTVITLDADLQDKPSEIPKLIAKKKEGFEVISGWREKRRDQQKMVFTSRLTNSIIGKLFKLRLHDYNCGLKVYTRDAAKSLRLYGGMHRFIPILAYQQGFSVTEVPVAHQARKYGKSKYSFSKYWKDLPDMFTMLFLIKYSKRPLHFFGIIGGIFMLVGFIILIYLTTLHFIGQSITRRPILFLGMLLVIAGLQVFFTGFLADLMINISHNSAMSDDKNTHYPIKFTNDKAFAK